MVAFGPGAPSRSGPGAPRLGLGTQETEKVMDEMKRVLLRMKNQDVMKRLLHSSEVLEVTY